MPENKGSRWVYIKRLRDPNDKDNTLDVQLLSAYMDFDAKSDAQGSGIVIDNGPDSSRIAYVKRVENSDDPDQYIDAERPVGIIIFDAKAGGQARGYILASDDPPPRQKDFEEGDVDFIASHVVRYCDGNDPDSDKWIDMERVDVLALFDAKSGALVRCLMMRWPENEVPDGDGAIPIDDPDDPFCDMPGGVTFAKVDDTLDVMEEFDRECADGSFIDVVDEDGGWRFDWFQHPVNISWGGVFEEEVEPAEEGGDPHQATVCQDDTAIDDTLRFMFSGFFNLDGPHSLFENDATGEWMLMEWGGGSPDDAGSPITSRISVAVDSDALESETQFCILASFEAAAESVEYDLGETFYGTPANVDLIGDFETDNTRVVQKTISGKIRIGNQAKVEEFQNKWHHLGVTFDLDAAPGDFNEDITAIRFQWVSESEGVWRVSDDAALDYAWSTFLSIYLNAHGVTASPVFVPGMDPFNTMYVSPVYDIRGIGNGHFSFDKFPPAGDLPRERVYILGKTGNFFQLEFPGFLYFGSALTSWPFADTKSGLTVPLKMVLDTKTKMDSYETGSNSLGKFEVGIEPEWEPDPRSGIPVKGKQIAVTHKSPDKIDAEGQFNGRVDIVTRLAVYQAWFNQSADIYDPLVMKRFVETRLDVESGKTFGKPAPLSPDDIALYDQLGTPPELRLSPASLAYGRPHIFMKGGPGSPDKVDPTLPRKGGFSHNRGTAGDFKLVGTAKSYSPGPSKIIIPNT